MWITSLVVEGYTVTFGVWITSLVVEGYTVKFVDENLSLNQFKGSDVTD